jgi:hypothetical protein
MARIRVAVRLLILLAIVAVLALGTAVPASANGHTIYNGWARVIPVIDGVFGAGEWDDAAMVDLQAVDPNNPMECYLYVKNNAEYLYVLWDVVGDATIFDDNICLSWAGPLLGGSGQDWAEGLGTSPNSGVTHAITEWRISMKVLGLSPGERFQFAAFYQDVGSGQWDEYPLWHGTGPQCDANLSEGEMVFASQRAPNVPALSLWGTLGMTVAMAAFVAWRLRRRTASL